MTKKRKLESKPSQPPLPMEKEEQTIAEEEEDPEELEGEEYEEVDEYEEENPEELEGEEAEEVVEYEEEDPEELEGEEEYEEEEQEEEANAEESAEEAEDTNKDEDDDVEPVQSLLSALNKEKLITLLSEAAERHPDVEARVRASVELDPSQRKIFVHGLNWDTTSEMLSEEFLKYGEIEDCRLITDKVTGRSKGYGFILFKTLRGARRALKEPQKVINNRSTSCQLASVGPVAAPLPQKQQPSEHTQRKIYVSNVGAELDPEKLKDFFSKYGEIEEGPLGLDKETGKPKGFCLFVYKSVDSAKWALIEPHKQFEGVTLHCRQAIDGPKSRKMQIIKSVENNQQFVDNVAPSVMPAFVQTPAPLEQQLLNVNPAALGQALTTLMAAQGAGLNLLGAVRAGTGLVYNPGFVPGFGSEVVQGGYGNGGVGINMGYNGMGGYADQGGNPIQQKRRRGAGRSKHGARPYMGQ